MSITSQKKKSLISTYAIKEDDTGSSFVQCAILTERISNLTEHFKTHKHDHNSKRGLLILIGRRRKHLNYIKRKFGNEAYQELIEKLGIRK
ncbi:30S ribosomal protein S15 [Wolbachia endosymbiont of Drosophila simulans wNo]|jgi:ribosomal protein S15, bacterial/organelle|uniref:30S ribosomal protein S15 n=1 Tax=unclassified Wolbachia TaxID=2640676 RepID=UPI0002D25570|nr:MULTISPECIES: 30S ribosomal protein S15 [unclassified Wolbachia]AGJ98911.1 30S ribosomal protein S15 [Wolbachia endosymbiont of Drosophila simulans wNo]AZU37444.1 30S ribosomal protein S15 [Wolbachia endosymbiont of Bemisia tabaci]OAB82084.1 30S ribosomal protein S15 [Wolbachia endosymbiont of Laodelphax striatellus]QCB63074.1 30S ribosomal protein S15 [Wolbachia endosymbiont of Drosophila mauritiana]QCB64119.1 30S ribosomal protein S15 [Wolbachia endosymbiont of Drosophila mauritiana]